MLSSPVQFLLTSIFIQFLGQILNVALRYSLQFPTYLTQKRHRRMVVSFALVHSWVRNSNWLKTTRTLHFSSGYWRTFCDNYTTGQEYTPTYSVQLTIDSHSFLQLIQVRYLIHANTVTYLRALSTWRRKSDETSDSLLMPPVRLIR
jgi:hypothetical protein